MNILNNNKTLGVAFIILLGCAIQSCSNKKELSKLAKNDVFNYVQISTGQVNLYDENGNVINGLQPIDSFFGQDANYLKGKKMSFQKNTDGIITDLNSGLMWQEIPTSEGFDWQNALS